MFDDADILARMSAEVCAGIEICQAASGGHIAASR
jgi:hypothetical protein